MTFQITNKQAAIAASLSLIIGGVGTYLLSPSKIEIKEVFKKEIDESKKIEKLTGKTRIEKKTKVDPNGTMETTEVIENDGSIDSESESKKVAIEESKDTIITNPKRLHLGVSYKGSIQDFSIENLLDYKKNVGLNVQYDTGFLNTFIGLEVFGDTTTVFTIGIIL